MSKEEAILKVNYEDIERCEKTFITLCKNHFIKWNSTKYKEWEKAYFSGCIMAFNYSVPSWSVALMSGREIVTKEQFNNN